MRSDGGQIIYDGTHDITSPLISILRLRQNDATAYIYVYYMTRENKLISSFKEKFVFSFVFVVGLKAGVVLL